MLEQSRLLNGILTREADRGYDNGTVLGGLDEMWQRFHEIEDQVRALRPMAGQRYSGLLPKERRAWHSAVQKWTAARQTKRAKHGSTPAKVAPKKQSSEPSRTERLPKGSGIDTRIEDIAGLHHSSRTALGNLGLKTVRDVLQHYPIRHIDYSVRTPISQLMPGVDATVIGDVVESRRNIHMRPHSATVRIRDDTGMLRVSWFNMPFMADRWNVGDRIVLSGQVGEFRGRATMSNPEYDDITISGREVGRKPIHAGAQVPVYPLTEGVNQRAVRNGIFKVLEIALRSVRDPLPEDIRLDHELLSAADAVRSVHIPSNRYELARGIRRMAFDECLYNQIAALRRRAKWRNDTVGTGIKPNAQAAESYVDSLDFSLTEDQRTALNAILRDISSGEPMARLMQGEVGSGKTVVAIASILAAVVGAEPNQAALMAPTEVLAEQHFINLINGLECTPLFGSRGPVYESKRISVGTTDNGRPLRAGLLTGSLSERAKAAVQEDIRNGKVEIIVGTHALLQEAVEFSNLALVVVDEQQRFGTEQRAVLTRRVPRPHLIAMSATPIPRTLHMAMYGDMDVSELTTLPHGRKTIATHSVQTPMDEATAFAHLRQELHNGRQAFVVCPLIDPSESIESASATATYARLKADELAEFKVDLLHGRMSISEKQDAMEQFRIGESQVLVSTTVIEVGVDVPNATVMMVMSADRFGMSQLHQLRGRVGRGEHPGTCYLVTDGQSEHANERITALVNSSDGFALATKDLQMRGPGRNLASQQSGWSGWKFAKFTDLDLIREARHTAEDILRQDPTLNSAKYRDLRRSIARAGINAQSELA